MNIHYKTTNIDLFRLILLMPSDHDNNSGWFDPDNEDDGIHFAVEVEQRIRQSRLIYDFAKEDKPPADNSVPVHAANRINEISSAKPDATGLAALGETPNDVDELLPDLDLGDLFAENDEALDSGIEETVDEEEQKVALLGDLDLFDLFDSGEGLARYLEDNEEIDVLEEGEPDPETVDFSSLLTEDDDVEDGEPFWFNCSPEPTVNTKAEEAIDWFAEELDNEEFLEDIDPEVEFDVDTESGITREVRALQAAIRTGVLFQLTNDDVRFLAEIYAANGWSACRVAIERELDAGTEMEELELAAAIKEMWLEHYEFYAGMISNYKVMSWPTALAIVRSFGGYPSLEEVEVLLEQLYEHWYYDTVSRKIHRYFGSYVISRFHLFQDDAVLKHEWEIKLASSFAGDEFLPPSTNDIPVGRLHSSKQISFPDIRKISAA